MNKSKIVLLLFVTIVLQFSCKGSNEIPFDKPKPIDTTSLKPTPEALMDKYVLVWNDEFEGKNLDLSKWMYRFDGALRTFSYMDSKNVSLNGTGQVVIKATKNANGEYYTGMISTEGIFQQQYGYFECKVMMQSTIGPHSAFWLQTPSIGATLNPANDGVEIDIFEYHKAFPDSVESNFHWNGYGVNHQTVGKRFYNPSVKTGFHVFGIEWTDSEYVIYIDGFEKLRTNNVPISKRPQFIVLSMEITGMGGDRALGTYPDQVKYDYVRVYKKK